MIRPQEIWATALEAVDNGCHFFIMDVVVLFCREESAGVEGDGVSSIGEFLTNDDTKGEIRCVCVHEELFGPVW